MPTIAPWLVPPNFLAAAESGARIGQQQSQFAAEQLMKGQELAASTGLGYARLNTEAAQAAAAQKEAQARLALQGNRYADLSQLGHERLDDTEQQRAASNDLKQQGLDLRAGQIQTTENQRDQMLDLTAQKLARSGVSSDKLGPYSVAVNNEAIAAKNDPRYAADPDSVLKDHPLAGMSPLIHIDYQNRGRVFVENMKPEEIEQNVKKYQSGAQVTTTTKSTIPNPNAAAGLVPTAGALQNLAAATNAVPVGSPPPAGKGTNEVQNGVLYKWNGFKYVPVR